MLDTGRLALEAIFSGSGRIDTAKIVNSKDIDPNTYDDKVFRTSISICLKGHVVKFKVRLLTFHCMLMCLISFYGPFWCMISFPFKGLLHRFFFQHALKSLEIAGIVLF